MGVLGLSPDEFGCLTFKEYLSMRKGYQLKMLQWAGYIGMGFNDPKQLSQLIMLNEAIVRREE